MYCTIERANIFLRWKGGFSLGTFGRRKPPKEEMKIFGIWEQLTLLHFYFSLFYLIQTSMDVMVTITTPLANPFGNCILFFKSRTRNNLSWRINPHFPLGKSRSRDVCRAAATLDDQWKVAFHKCVFGHGDPSLVVRVVNPLIPGRVHVAQPLRSLLASVEIPVNHPLAVVQTVLSPDHPVALARENCAGTFLGGDVYYRHHHPFRIGCVCWDCNRKKGKELHYNNRCLQLKMEAAIYILNLKPNKS